MRKFAETFDQRNPKSVNSVFHNKGIGGGALKDKTVEILATAFYAGKSPIAPGTMGTIVAIPLVLLISLAGPINYMIITLLAVIFSIFISQAYENKVGTHDCQEIVIDEVVGFMVAMTWLPMTWTSLLAGFVLFRLLDALKPVPIRWVDQKIDGGLGVVADDVVAGLIANLILQVVYTKTQWLGEQWVPL